MDQVRSVQLWGPGGMCLVHENFPEPSTWLSCEGEERPATKVFIWDLRVSSIPRPQVKVRPREVHCDSEERCPDFLDGVLTPALLVLGSDLPRGLCGQTLAL